MRPMMGGMGGVFLLYGLIWIVVVAALLVALWRGMRAQERIAGHLERIEQALRARSIP
jgi:uncharacterized membrane protein